MMKKRFVLVFVLMLMLVLSVQSRAETSVKFRNSEWGMSFKEVKKHETLTYIGNYENSHYFALPFKGYDGVTFYSFYNDKLYQAGYMISSGYEGYIYFKGLLQDKYGKGTEKSQWKYGLYKNNLSKAVQTGDLTITCFWQTKECEVTIIVQSQNNDPIIMIEYKHKKLSEEYEKYKKSKEKSNL